MALKRREWSSPHEAGWATRRYRRKIGCTVALDGNHGYDMTIGGSWVEGVPHGYAGAWGVVGTRGARPRRSWVRWRRLRVGASQRFCRGVPAPRRVIPARAPPPTRFLN